MSVAPSQRVTSHDYSRPFRPRTVALANRACRVLWLVGIGASRRAVDG
jgi:hypothetical protein